MQQNSGNKHLDAIRHTLAHLLAMAVLKKFPRAQLGIGPTVEHGFYYDFKLPRQLAPENLSEFEKEMRFLIATKLRVRGGKITALTAKKLFANQLFKLDLIRDFVKEKKQLTIYITGETPQKKITNIINFGKVNRVPPPSSPLLHKEGGVGGSSGPHSLNTHSYFIDLCRGGHVKNTSEINPDAFRLTHIAGAYWKGSEKNPQLQRIYGVAFATKEELQKHLAMLEEAKKRDHRKLGEALGIFMMDNLVGKGLPLWLPNGTIIRNEIEKMAVKMEGEYGYQRVSTPHLAKKELYFTSGHLPYYRDSMYPAMEMDDGVYYLKAMNCPHHHVIYKHRPHSYRELPIRFAEYGTVYRNELSGTLAGLLRVRMLSMNDAHIYCTKEQIENEVKKVLELTLRYFKIFDLHDFWFRLSKWDRKNKTKYINEPKNWEYTEKILRRVLAKTGAGFEEVLDEAAFYGPKIDIQFRTIAGREETMSTIQLDFMAKKRFGLKYIDADGKENSEVFVIHRAPLSTHERFIAFLLEHYAGAFPFWLAPVQIAILPINNKNEEYIRKIESALTEKNIRFETNRRNESISKKIREAEIQKIPHLLIVGDKEAQQNTVALRKRGKRDLGSMPLEKAMEIMVRS